MARNIHKNKPFVSNRELPENRAKPRAPLDDLDEMFCQEGLLGHTDHPIESYAADQVSDLSGQWHWRQTLVCFCPMT